MSSEESTETRSFRTFKESFLLNLVSEQPSVQLRQWYSKGTLRKHLPELDKCGSVQQDPHFHPDTVFEHLIKTCDNIAPKPFLRWSALLHDIGKAKTRKQHIYCQLDAPRKIEYVICPSSQKLCTMECQNALSKTTFYHHAVVGTRIAKKILRNFRVGGRQTRQILYLIMNHMYYFVPEWTDGAIQRFIHKTQITKDNLLDSSNYPLFCLRAADRMSRDLEPMSERQLLFEKRLLEHFEKEAA